MDTWLVRYLLGIEFSFCWSISDIYVPTVRQSNNTTPRPPMYWAIPMVERRQRKSARSFLFSRDVTFDTRVTDVCKERWFWLPLELVNLFFFGVKKFWKNRIIRYYTVECLYVFT